jgi:hypothetical protein
LLLGLRSARHGGTANLRRGLLRSSDHGENRN